MSAFVSLTLIDLIPSSHYPGSAPVRPERDPTLTLSQPHFYTRHHGPEVQLTNPTNAFPLVSHLGPVITLQPMLEASVIHRQGKSAYAP